MWPTDGVLEHTTKAAHKIEGHPNNLWILANSNISALFINYTECTT